MSLAEDSKLDPGGQSRKEKMKNDIASKWLFCDGDPSENIHKFVTTQKRLLEIELQSQEDELKQSTELNTKELEERASYALHKLEVIQVSIGLYGRTVLALYASLNSEDILGETKNKALSLLPAHKFTVGDDVEVRGSPRNKADSKASVRGVVSQVTESSISIALNDQPRNRSNAVNSNHNEFQDDLPFETSSLSVLATSSVEVHRKMLKAMEELSSFGLEHECSSHVIQAFFGRQPLRFQPIKVSYIPFNHALDPSQLEAVKFALSTESLALIHGPPGTGKTTTVVELIKQAVCYKNWKVLVCAPSNVAVDNILERLAAVSDKKSQKMKCMRLGHPARLQPSVLEHSMERLIQSADGSEIVRDCKKELKQYLDTLSACYDNNKSKKGKIKDPNNKPTSSYAERRQARSEISHLRKEIRAREERVLEELIRSRQVILATNVGAASKVLDGTSFDLVVIDEAAQALEASCWIPALRGNRLVLAGDHKQLAPTIQSRDAGAKGLGYTMFDRALGIHGSNSVSRMLSVQYRMHQCISDWSSNAMYEGKLQSAACVAHRKLADLPKILKVSSINKSVNDMEDDGLLYINLLLIDTAGCDIEEETTPSGSKRNLGEARIVEQHVKQLLDAGLEESDIAIITPYNGQVELIRNMMLPLHPKLEIRSVDGFQGGEREAVVLSLVRSNDRGIVGFLGDDRRLNVAVTRAKRQCAVICDTDTVTSNTFIKDLVKWIEENGQYSSAMEYTAAFEENAVTADIESAMEYMTLVEETFETVGAQPSNTKSPTNNATESSSAVLLSNSQNDQLHSSSGISSDACRQFTTPTPEPFSNDENLEQVNKHVVSSEDESDNEMYSDDEEMQELTNLSMNDTLKILAEERMQRKLSTQNSDATLPGKQNGSKKKSTQKKSGRKVDGTTKSKKKNEDSNVDDEDDDLDDMAFLEKQVAIVQNSHGRKIDAAGVNYRTVVNGILIAKPLPHAKKRDERAASALKQKLKQAEVGRQSKAVFGKKKR